MSPGWVRETLAAVGEDGGVPADVLARVYVDAVEGAMTAAPTDDGGWRVTAAFPVLVAVTGSPA